MDGCFSFRDRGRCRGEGMLGGGGGLSFLCLIVKGAIQHENSPGLYVYKKIWMDGWMVLVPRSWQVPRRGYVGGGGS